MIHQFQPKELLVGCHLPPVSLASSISEPNARPWEKQLSVGNPVSAARIGPDPAWWGAVTGEPLQADW